MVLREDLGFVWRQFVRAARASWMTWLGRVLVFFVISGLFLFPADLSLLRRVQQPEGWSHLEEFLAVWGDFLPFNVGVAILLLLAGVVRRDRWLRRAALAFFLAGALSGLTTRVVKMSAGRARPRTVEKQDLHWVSFKGFTASGKYHGYWSGHTASSMASAVALAVIFPRVGWIAVLFAGAVGWSRIYGNHHFPSDVFHGAMWGVMWGYLAGAGVARAKRNGPEGKPSGSEAGESRKRNPQSEDGADERFLGTSATSSIQLLVAGDQPATLTSSHSPPPACKLATARWKSSLSRRALVGGI